MTMCRRTDDQGCHHDIVVVTYCLPSDPTSFALNDSSLESVYVTTSINSVLARDSVLLTTLIHGPTLRINHKMTNSVDFQTARTLFFDLYSMYGIYGLFLAAVAVYSVALIIYRLYLHPLARFPGPKIAAATGWYEFYHEVIRGGMYIHEIQRMHREYGT